MDPMMYAIFCYQFAVIMNPMMMQYLAIPMDPYGVMQYFAF